MEGIEQQVLVRPLGDSLAVPVIAGGVAGLFTDIALFPLDTVKTRLQQPDRTGFQWRGLYQGLGPAALAAAPSAAIFFGTYEFMKKKLSADGGLSQGTAAAVAEVAACMFKVPFEVVKQRLQVDASQSGFHIIRSIWRREGVRGCYSGFTATVFREVPFGFIQMPVYELLKREVLARNKRNDQKLGSVEACACGAAAGGIAAAVTCPIDVWKTRLMLGSKNTTILSILRNEGVGALFAGLTPRVLWISVGGSVFFGAYEFVSGLIRGQDLLK
jgi:solute carrier family 25 S-adenosylmethionine transporter 26